MMSFLLREGLHRLSQTKHPLCGHQHALTAYFELVISTLWPLSVLVGYVDQNVSLLAHSPRVVCRSTPIWAAELYLWPLPSHVHSDCHSLSSTSEFPHQELRGSLDGDHSSSRTGSHWLNYFLSCSLQT